MALPRILRGFNLFIDGDSYAGKVTELKLPTLSRKIEEFRAGGMDGSVAIDMGQEKLEMEFTLAEFSPAVLRKFGEPGIVGVPLRFKGAAEADLGDANMNAIEIVARGRWQSIGRDKVKQADLSEMKVTASLAYYKETVNDADLIEIDVIDMVFKVSGRDLLKERRQALGV